MNMPVQQALAKYGAVKVTTANPGQILVMLYDGLLRFLREASDAMTAKQRGRAGERISRSMAIVRQLLSDLDPTHAPELCQNLRALYMFCIQHLLEANVEQSPAKIDNVIRVLTPLRDAWAEAVTQTSRRVPTLVSVTR
jgi:flagellar protein FliS